MKDHFKYYLPLTVFLFSFWTANCQEEINLKLRHIKGVKGMEIGGGITKFGSYYQASYLHFIKDKFYMKPSFAFETGKIGLTQYQEHSLFIEFDRDLFVLKEFLFVSVGLAPAIQVQNTNNEIVKPNNIYYPLGVMMNVNLEFFIFNKVTLNAQVAEIYSPKDKFGAFRYTIGGGVKIYF